MPLEYFTPSWKFHCMILVIFYSLSPPYPTYFKLNFFFIFLNTFPSLLAANLFCFTEKQRLQKKRRTSFFSTPAKLPSSWFSIFFVSTSEESMSVPLLSLVVVLQMLSSVWLCDPTEPGFPVLHYLPEFAQTHVHESVMLSNHLILPILFSFYLQSFPATGSLHLLKTISTVWDLGPILLELLEEISLSVFSLFSWVISLITHKDIKAVSLVLKSNQILSVPYS